MKLIDRLDNYGKALIITLNDTLYLQSYDTIVLSFNTDYRFYTRHWDGYSVTSGKHMRDFVREYVRYYPANDAKSFKQWYESLPYVELSDNLIADIYRL